MDGVTENVAEVAALSLEENGNDEKAVQDQAAAVDCSANDVGDSKDSKAAAAKKKKAKKKKKKSSVGVRENATMPTQAIVELTFPYKAVNKPNIGRCAIAAKDIKAGELIIAEQTVAFIPRSQNSKLVCHFCCRDLSSLRSSPFQCPGCQHCVFCKDCEVPGMEDHMRWCHLSRAVGAIAVASDCDEDLLRFVLTLVLQQQHATEKSPVDNCNASSNTSNGVSKQGTVKDGIIHPVYEDVLCLKTHSENMSAGWKASVKKGCQLLYDKALEVEGGLLPELNTITAEDLENLAALVNTNSHGMGAHGSGIHNTDVAVGIFPFVSILNHSCRPNCCFASDGRVMYVRAAQDIPKDTQVCVTYINLYEPRGTRQRQLAMSKHFLCRCVRCSEPLASSVDRFLEGCVCTVRGCGGVIVRASSYENAHLRDSKAAVPSSAAWECDQCSRILEPNVQAVYNTARKGSAGDQPWMLVAKAEQKLAEAMIVYRERRFKDARVLLEQYVAEYTGKLHELHVLLFDALTPLMNCCRAMGDAGEGSRVCKLILNCMKTVVPGISLELANFYFCLGEMYQDRSQASATGVMIKHYHKLAQEAFQQVKVIRETCLGKASLPG